VIKNAVTGTFSAEATPVMTVTGRTIPWQRRKLMMALDFGAAGFAFA